MGAPITQTPREAFEEWKRNPDQVADPIKRVAAVMARLADVQAETLNLMKDDMVRVTDHVAEVNRLMGVVNDAIAASTKDPDTARTFVMQGTRAEAQAVLDQLAAEGIDPTSMEITDGNNDGIWGLWFKTKTQAQTAASKLQTRASDLSSLTQSKQLSLQTMVGRYNGTFEVVTSSIKKSETQGDSISANIRK